MANTEKVRLNKYLAESGLCSRRDADRLIEEGRVRVNGRMPSPGMKVNDLDKITVDEKPVARREKKVVLAYYKPQGVTCTEKDRHAEVTIRDVLDYPVRLTYAGRLDRDSEGLLLLTNDGKLAHELLSPRRHVDKVYYVEYDGLLPADAPSRFEAGLTLEDGTKTMAAVWEDDGEGRGRLTIREGKFHQVKRMFEALGCRVSYLKRLSMGALVLDPALEPGQYRPLTESELESLGRS